jgi:hypothetical protein
MKLKKWKSLSALIHDPLCHKLPYRGLIGWHCMRPSNISMIGTLRQPTPNLPPMSDNAFASTGQKRPRMAPTVTAPPSGSRSIEDGYGDGKPTTGNK